MLESRLQAATRGETHVIDRLKPGLQLHVAEFADTLSGGLERVDGLL